jgi:hypothetical protein
MANKPVILWDQYLSQALFAIRVRLHATSRVSPYTLLFGKEARLPSDPNTIRPMKVDPEEYNTAVTERIEKMRHARQIANETLVSRAIAAKKLRSLKVKVSGFKEGDWVLVRAEARHKFEGRWYGPYRVVKALTLGTYQLADPSGNIVTTLINGQRLISARVTDQTQKQLWNDSRMQWSLRKRGMELEKSSPEVAALFEEQNQVEMTYDELSAVPAAEWKKLEAEKRKVAERYGERLLEMGEELELSPEDIRNLGQRIEEALIESNRATTKIALAQPTETTERGTYPSEVPRDALPLVTEAIITPSALPELMEVEQEIESMEVDPPEDQVPLPYPLIPKGTKRPYWQREVAASTADRDRVETRYGLREKPRKTKL